MWQGQKYGSAMDICAFTYSAKYSFINGVMQSKYTLTLRIKLSVARFMKSLMFDAKHI